MFHLIRNYLEQAHLRIYMLYFVDRGVLLGGGECYLVEQVFLLLCKFTVTCSVHACLRTYFNVTIALNISGLGALHTGRDAL